MVDPSSLPEINALDKDILPLEVFEAIRAIKNGKSPGLDGIGGSLLKHLDDRLCSPLAHLFNHICTRLMYIPAPGQKHSFDPQKSGSRLSTDSYSGIALLSQLGKVFARIIPA